MLISRPVRNQCWELRGRPECAKGADPISDAGDPDHGRVGGAALQGAPSHHRTPGGLTPPRGRRCSRAVARRGCRWYGRSDARGPPRSRPAGLPGSTDALVGAVSGGLHAPRPGTEGRRCGTDSRVTLDPFRQPAPRAGSFDPPTACGASHSLSAMRVPRAGSLGLEAAASGSLADSVRFRIDLRPAPAIQMPRVRPSLRRPRGVPTWCEARREIGGVHRRLCEGTKLPAGLGAPR